MELHLIDELLVAILRLLLDEDREVDGVAQEICLKSIARVMGTPLFLDEDVEDLAAR